MKNEGHEYREWWVLKRHGGVRGTVWIMAAMLFIAGFAFLMGRAPFNPDISETVETVVSCRGYNPDGSHNDSLDRTFLMRYVASSDTQGSPWMMCGSLFPEKPSDPIAFTYLAYGEGRDGTPLWWYIVYYEDGSEPYIEMPARILSIVEIP